MPNSYIDSIRLSGTTYQIQGSGGGGTVDPSLDPTSTNPVANSAITAALGDKVNVADNNVSAYTFENKIGSAEFGYSEHFAGPIYIRYTGSTSSSGGYYAGGITYYTSEWGWGNVGLDFSLSNGQITATTVSSNYFDIEIENGEAALTFKDGYYLRQYNSQNGFIALTKTAYESGQSADVIEDTVYDVFDKLNDKIDKAGDNAVTGGNISFIDGYIGSSLYTNKTSLYSSVKIDSSTIKSSNDGLSVQFATPEVGDKILNVGSGSYGELFSTSSYGTSINEFTITFNPNCTQYNVYNFSVRIIDASNAMYDVTFEYDSADMSAVYTSLNTYCTVTDTLPTDYKLKVTAKEGYKIARLYNGNYMVGGVDNTNPNNYISNLVTTPSYVHDGQDVIDDIYDKLDDKQDTLVSSQNIKTVNNQSLLGSGNIDIQGGGGKAIELTQAQYDALVDKDPNVFYIITDAEAGDLTNYYTKTETDTLLDDKLDVTAYTPTDLSNYYTKSETSGATQIQTALNGKADSSTVNSLNNVVIAHTADTTVHVTAQDKTNWNNKSDFSGNYNDLTNKPTIPSKTSDLTNDSDFATTGDVQTATNDMATKAWVGQQGYLTQHQDISGKQDVSGMTAYTETSAFTAHTADTTIHVTNAEKATWNAKSDFSGSYNDLTNKLSAGTNVSIVDNVINAEGGGKAIEAGRGISITTGETADTVSFNLPISAGTGTNSLIVGYNSSDSFWKPTASGRYSIAHGSKCTAGYETSIATGYYNEALANYSIAQGYHTTTYGGSSHSEGWDSVTRASYSHAEGNNCITSGESSHAEGIFTNTSNKGEHSEGWYNVTRKNSTTFGDSGNTLFSVGNGTADNARHNAFEIRQNGDIYLTKDGQDVKLQDQLGGSSINVVQTTGTSTTDVMSQNAVTSQLSGYVTTDTEQIISGRKIFTFTSSTNKAIEFKQTDDSSKVGFRVRTSAATNNELASFEFRPNTFTVDGVQHPLLYFGHYRNTNTANAGVPQTVIGFRQYDQKNIAAYHYLMPLPEKAKTPFRLTTTFKDYYAPMGFKNGSTMITADDTGVVDLSSELGGLKLKKLTQAEYDALATKDSNTLYVIVN